MNGIDEKKERVKELLAEASPRQKLLPLSTSQLKSWNYQKMDPESPFYNLSIQVTLEGQLSVSALQGALGQLLKAHDALNIRFVELASGPVQFLVSPEHFEMGMVDLRMQSQSVQEQTLLKLVSEWALRRFKLASDPLFAATLVRLTDDKSELLIRTHHIICDGISCFILLRDLARIYHAISNGNKPDLPKFQLSVLQYIEMQLQLTGGPTMDVQRDFWVKKLAGAPTKINLPDTEALNDDLPASSGFETALWEAAHFAEIKTFCQQHGLTPFMFMVSIFFVSIYQWTGQTDLITGTMVNYRSELDKETWDMVGEFTNYIALRTQLQPSMSFIEFVKQVKSTVLEAHSNATIPFERVTEAMNEVRKKSHEPMYQIDSINTDIVMHNILFPDSLSFSPVLKGYVTMIPTGLGHEVNLLDLGIQLHLVTEGLMVELQFNRNRIQASQASALLQQMKLLAHKFVQNSEEKIANEAIIGS